uniref:Ubiquitin carboxyl-terminal hydrolase 36 n=1 Tax=Malurus cyaneus samueli TaxID=2593467 RepID=A0A8C5TEP9_9PASS
MQHHSPPHSGPCLAITQGKVQLPPLVSSLFKCCFPAVTGKGMNSPERILFSPEKIYMNWRQKRRPGAGLYNLGSTCYLNVVLQCLTYTPPLANYLLSRQHSRCCRQQGFCMMCIMEDHVRKVLYSSATAIRPRAVIRDLKFIGQFKPDIPGDAYEFLRCTISAMQKACLNEGSE